MCIMLLLVVLDNSFRLQMQARRSIAHWSIAPAPLYDSASKHTNVGLLESSESTIDLVHVGGAIGEFDRGNAVEFHLVGAKPDHVSIGSLFKGGGVILYGREQKQC